MRIRQALLALLLVVCPAVLAAPPKPEPLRVVTKKQWHDDVAHFARELPKRHMNAFHAVSREAFDAAVKELDLSIDTASDDAIVAGLMRLASMVGDGHTTVHIPSNWHRLAIVMQPFGDEWRVMRVTAPTKALLGGKVTAIGGVPIAEVARRLSVLSPQDELAPMQRVILSQSMHMGEVLHGMGITPSAAEAEISVVGEDGATATATATAVPIAEQTKQAWIGLSSGAPPISRREPESPFVVQYLPQQKTVYVNWRRYENLADNAAKLWQLVDTSEVTKIVIDLRQNGGGDFNVGRRYMVSETARRAAKIKPIVLIGPRTFSAAVANAIDFRNDAHALLAGETIGEKPNSYSENDEFLLPASHVLVSYSTRFYKFVPESAPNVVEPDQRVEQTWADAKAGRDAVLEWALGTGRVENPSHI